MNPFKFGKKTGIHDPIPSFVWHPWAKPKLPVFTFHGVEPETFERFLMHLKQNGYRTLRAGEMLEVLERGKRRYSEKSVALTFDDGRFSEWVYGYPLLKKYGFTAICFIVPHRIEAAGNLRANTETDPKRDWRAECQNTRNWWRQTLNWSELRYSSEEGVFDVQSHSLRHEIIFCGGRVLDFQRPTAMGAPLYPEIAISENGQPCWGAPIFERCWKPAVREAFIPDPELTSACEQYVKKEGGIHFFSKPLWRSELKSLVRGRTAGKWIPVQNSPMDLAEELQKSREIIEAKIGKPCLFFSPPNHSYDIRVTEHAVRAGYRAFFNGSNLRAHEKRVGLWMIKRYGGHWGVYLPGQNRKMFIPSKLSQFF